jgi:hypothetical protein
MAGMEPGFSRRDPQESPATDAARGFALFQGNSLRFSFFSLKSQCPKSEGRGHAREQIRSDALFEPVAFAEEPP